MNDRPSLDLTKHHFSRALVGKGITVYGSWWREHGQWTPCLVLLPTNRKISHERVRPCVVPLFDAHLWAEETGTPEYAYGAGQTFADLLGTDVVSVINAIQSEIGELLTMPPLPPGELVVVADATAMDESGRVQSYEITERR